MKQVSKHLDNYGVNRDEIADRIQRLREAQGLSYHQLAARMKNMGCDIHASGIQKTEKSGRRITVEELVGYARALGVEIEHLISGDRPQRVTAGSRDTYFHAEDLQDVIQRLRVSYDRLIVRSRLAAKNDPEFRRWLEERYSGALSVQAAKLAKSQRLDTGSPEVEQLLRDNMSPAMRAAADALREPPAGAMGTVEAESDAEALEEMVRAATVGLEPVGDEPAVEPEMGKDGRLRVKFKDESRQDARGRTVD